MDTDASETITAAETKGSWRLWFAVLGSPLAWSAALVVNYSLGEVFACSPAARPRGEILGFSVHTVATVVTSAMGLVAAASGLVAFSCWRRLRQAGTGDERLDRARWMAFAGVVEVVLFLPAILLGYIPPFLIHACEVTP
jgi:di/tricarboxylate transporter